MAYAKVNNGTVTRTGNIFTLLPQVSNAKALSQEELKEKGVYKVQSDSTNIEPWQKVKEVSYEFKDDEVCEVKEIIDTPLEDYKAVKDKEIKSTLYQIINEGFTGSNGGKIDIKEQDRSNWMSNLELMSLSGQTETEIRDFNNVTHILTFDEYKSLVIEAGDYVQQQFKNKWKLNKLVNDATTYQEVHDIYWRTANYDENDEFTGWSYNPILE